MLVCTFYEPASTSTSTLKRVIQCTIDPQRHANSGGFKSSSPGSARASAEDDSSSCARASPKHASAPCPSCQTQLVAPADHALVYAAVAVDALAIQLRSHEAQPYELRRAFLAFLFGCEHTAPAYNHIPSGGEECDEQFHWWDANDYT